MSSPHDHFFAFTFGQKEHAIGLLQATLPPGLAARLEWGSLERRPADFVDARLRGRQSDLLFSVRTVDTQEEILVYALVEHQSTAPPLMVYRMLRYLVRVWEDHLKAHKGAVRLPFVFSLVIYHGKAPWTAACDLQEVVHLPEPLGAVMAEQVPRFRFQLVDLRHEHGHQVAHELLTTFGRVALWAMSVAGDDRRMLDEVGRMFAVLNTMVAEPDGEAAFGALLRYLSATHDPAVRPRLQRELEKVHPAAGEYFMTLMQHLIEEGERQGLEKGRASFLLEQLQAKFGPVSETVQARVKAAAPAELSAWGTHILTAKTMAEVFGSAAAPRRPRRPARPRR